MESVLNSIKNQDVAPLTRQRMLFLMTYTRRNFQLESVERTPHQHQSLINYANDLRTAAVLPSPCVTRTRNPEFPFPL